MDLTDRLKNPNPEEVRNVISRRGFIGRALAGAGLAAAVIGYGGNAGGQVNPKEQLLKSLGWEPWVPLVDYPFPNTSVFGGVQFNYFVRAGAPATISDFTIPPEYNQNNGFLTMNGTNATYDAFGMNEQGGPLRLTAWFEPFSLIPGAACYIELGNNTRLDRISVGFRTGLGIVAYERIGGNTPTQMGSTITYSGTSLAVRLTKDSGGITTVEYSLNAGTTWEKPVGTSYALDGIGCHAGVLPQFRTGFQPCTTRYLLAVPNPEPPPQVPAAGVLGLGTLGIILVGVGAYRLIKNESEK